jgi:hypothetical protein
MSTPGSFTIKRLRVTFILAQGGNTFPGTGTNTLVVDSLRTVADLKGALAFLPQLDLEVYGMRQQDMNALSVIRFGVDAQAVPNNIVTLEADSGSGYTQVFTGTIIEASPEYRGAPDVYFHLQAMTGYLGGITPAPPLSYPSGVSVASALQSVANAIGVGFINNGVTATLSGARYWPGSAGDQLKAICDATNTDFYFDASSNLVIAPKGAGHAPPQPIVLTPTTGLIGYPSITASGIHLDALFNPAFLLGQNITVQGSEVPNANGDWVPFSVNYQLESLKFGGQWMASMDCIPVATAQPTYDQNVDD